MGSPAVIQKAKAIITANTDKVGVVVSAVGKTTDKLLRMAKMAEQGDRTYLALLEEIEKDNKAVYYELTGQAESGAIVSFFKQLKRVCDGVFLLRELTGRSLDFILSTGELLSSTILTDYLTKEGYEAVLFDSRHLIVTDQTFGNAKVNFELTGKRVKAVKDDLAAINIFPGFIAAAETGETTTLGRGGSDYTAAIYAALFESAVLEIWTDVDGLMTADPRIVKRAKIIREIAYEEAIELSYFGAKVLHPPSLQPCMHNKVPIRIKNTFRADNEGTLVHHSANSRQIVSGITSLKDVSMITLSGLGMLTTPRYTKTFFSVLADHGLSPDFITRSNAEYTMTIAMAADKAEKALGILHHAFEKDMENGHIEPLAIERDLSILALVGSNMKNQVGISGNMFHVLGKNGVSIKAISQGSSERNISGIIRKSDLAKSLNILHEAFFSYETKRINLFIIGVGNVGKAFVEQLKSQFTILKSEHRVNLKLIGVANSKKMAFDEDGIRLSRWQEKLYDEGEPFSTEAFLQKMIACNFRNSIFLDITASKAISDTYTEVLAKSISVVTPNKIAATESFEKYKQLKATASRYGSRFFIETNVCAGLPILSTLSDIVRSGDRVHHIEAVLSGTLNFLFNEYNGSQEFVEVIQKAKAEGYTEPDPRLDLSGEDVKRKLLILIRESGYTFEMDQIVLEPFMPPSCADTDSIEDFYDKTKAEEPYFKKLYDQASANSARLKVVAKFMDRKAMVKLEEISPEHPFYNLEGKDNIVLFYTDRYKDQPLVIKGAGAGAEVTASGIFADVLRLATPES